MPKKKNSVELPQDVKKTSEKVRQEMLEPMIRNIVEEYLMIQQQTFDEVLTLLSNRIHTIELLLIKNVAGVNKTALATTMAKVEDTRNNLVEVKGGARPQDTVRCEISFKEKDIVKYPPAQSLKFVALGSPTDNLDKDIRKNLFAMKKGQVKEFDFEKNGKVYRVKVVMNMVSRPKHLIPQKKTIMQKLKAFFTKKKVIKVTEPVKDCDCESCDGKDCNCNVETPKGE